MNYLGIWIFLCMALFHHEKSCEQWFSVLQIKECGQVCGGLPFLGLLPKGVSLQKKSRSKKKKKTEVELNLLSWSVKPNSSGHLKEICLLSLLSVLWISKVFPLQWTWKFRWKLFWFFSKAGTTWSHDVGPLLTCGGYPHGWLPLWLWKKSGQAEVLPFSPPDYLDW